MPHTRRLWSMLVVTSLLTVACGSTNTTTNSAATSAPDAAATTAPAAPTSAPDAAATTAPATTANAPVTAATAATGSAPTSASAATSATTSATGATAAADPLSFTLPADLRTDLEGATVTYIGSSTQANFEFQSAVAKRFTEATGIAVNIIRGPESSTERLAQYQQQLGAQSAEVDVYEIDVTWPGTLAQYAEDVSDVVEGRNFFPAIVENNTVDGKLVGVPMSTNAGLLFYRTDLLQKYNLEPPTTWAELEAQARTIQEGERATNPNFWGFVWQGNAYEGLTCNALEWQVSNGGGSIIEPDGTVSVNNPQAVAALERASGWVGTISPPDVTTYMEEQARAVWQAGNAAFMRNWPYIFALGQAQDSVIRDKFDVTLLPQGDGPDARSAAALGGWQLMVSAYSQNKEAAKEFVKFMTSPEVQAARAIVLSSLPTIADVYENPDVLAKNPHFESLLPVLGGGAVARPSTVAGDVYNDVSISYFTAVNQVLTGQQEAGPALETLQAELEELFE